MRLRFAGGLLLTLPILYTANWSPSSVCVAVLPRPSSFVSRMTFTAPSLPAGPMRQRSRPSPWSRPLRHCLICWASATSHHALPNFATARSPTGLGLGQPTVRVLLTRGVPAPLHLDSGGVPLSEHPVPSDRCVVPPQGWPALATECQRRSVWLLAPRAFTLVMAQAAGHFQEGHSAAHSS
jgi:hypothetical protein